MTPRITPTQAQALWAIYRAGRLTTLNQWEYVDHDGRVRGQTINGLQHRRMIDATSLPSWHVNTPERTFSSVVQWEAALTRAGQEWIAEQFVETEGLPSPHTPS